MPVHVCPRCQRTNPEAAAYCYNDGALLPAAAAGNGKTAPPAQFSRDFVFPSGRRCKSFDDLSQACQEEWTAARDLLREGIFKQFFTHMGRADLVRATQEAMGHADSDMGLTSFLGVLPQTRSLEPKLDIHPRRLDLGELTIGDIKRVQFSVSNIGQGQLQGTVKIDVGGDWLLLPNQAKSCAISLAPKRDQKITLEVNSQTLIALQNYGGKLVVVTNGGVAEVPVRLDVASRPFGSPPFPQAKTPREMAEHMRHNSRAAVPLLESGEVFRWFATNNWNYPVQGQPIMGMAGVQQFFEAMGLSKAPPLSLSQSEFRFRCDSPDPIRFQVVLGTPTRKWVYALVESDRSWLQVLTPQVGGPQKAIISFEVDTGSILSVPLSEAKVKILANAGQKLPVRVVIESTHPSALTGAAGAITARKPEPGRAKADSVGVTPRPTPRAASAPAGSSPWSALLAMAVLFLAVRICLIPVVDCWARSAAIREAAAAPGVNQNIAPESPLNKLGGWLRMPWMQILLALNEKDTMKASLFDDASERDISLLEFRYRFVKIFVRDVIVALWWLGPIFGLMLVWKRGGGWQDLHWGLLAGAMGGVIASATLACVFLLIESLPHAFWGLFLSGKGDQFLQFVWLTLSLLTWLGTGILIGLVLGLIGPLRRAIVDPVQELLAWLWGVAR